MQGLSRRTLLTGGLASATLPVWAQSIPSNPDVVVIGAGSAGIAAARTLIALRKTVVIVEGANRIGGRAYTESATFGVPYDHGCFNLMGPSNFPYLETARRLGLDLHTMNGAGETVFVGNRRASGTEGNEYEAAWRAINNALTKAGREGKDISAADAMPDDIKNMSFAGLCKTWIGAMDFAVDFDELSVQDWWNYGDTPTQKMVRQGYGTLVTEVGKNLPVMINTPATRINWSGNGVTVETPAGSIQAAACIVTVSPGVLSAGSIKFSPELPEWKQGAIGNMRMGLLAKTALQFDGEKFGLSANQWLSYQVVNEMPAEACFFLTWPFSQNIMVGYVGGQFGWELSGAGPDAAVNFALQELVNMLGSGVRKHFVKGHFTGWADNPWTLGAYAAVIPGAYDARSMLAQPVADRVFFAGEAVAGEYIQLCSGAYMSGEKTARAVAKII